MKINRLLSIIVCLLFAATAHAQSTDSATVDAPDKKGEIVKQGLNFGPLPAVAFDADKGFQLGALLNIYDFGDG